MHQHLLLIFLLTTVAMATAPYDTSCVTARRNCARRFGCSTMLSSLHVSCAQLYNPYARITKCPYLCVKALAVFLMMAANDNLNSNLLNCSCGADQTCARSRTKLQQVCYKETKKEMRNLEKNYQKPTCLFAQWICKADNRCQIALQYYMQGCRKLWRPRKRRQPKCTRRCRNSLLVLASVPSARYLHSCECTPKEETMMSFITGGVTCKEMQETTNRHCPKYLHRFRHFHHRKRNLKKRKKVKHAAKDN